VFFLVPAHPGSPGQSAIKRSSSSSTDFRSTYGYNHICCKTPRSNSTIILCLNNKKPVATDTFVWKHECNAVRNGCFADSANMRRSVIVHSTSSSSMIMCFLSTFTANSSVVCLCCASSTCKTKQLCYPAVQCVSASVSFSTMTKLLSHLQPANQKNNCKTSIKHHKQRLKSRHPFSICTFFATIKPNVLTHSNNTLLFC